MFLGRAVLQVQSGEVTALGATLTPASGPVELAADERCGGALLLEPGQPEGAVPLAATGSPVLRLSRVPGSSDGSSSAPPATPPTAGTAATAGTADGGAAGRQQLGFDVWLTSDPAAPPVPPPLPPLWHQAAGEVQHTLAAAAAAQGAAGTGQPPVIVVCGAKKVGKSTFARFLLNSLLAQYGCVAYLDTGMGWQREWEGGRRRLGQCSAALVWAVPIAACHAALVFLQLGLHAVISPCPQDAQSLPASLPALRRLWPAGVHCSRPRLAQPCDRSSAGPSPHAPAPPRCRLLCGRRLTRQ